MEIHNYYTDLLESVPILFDKYIFGSNKIKSYEFNIGNRTFQLNKGYKPNFDLPAAIISLNEETFNFGERPTGIQKIIAANYNQIPVLFNNTNNRVIYLQEDQASININITINCESQFMAKELDYICKRNLPVNKYIRLFKFNSFLEIDNKYLTNNNFNTNEDDITNLFIKRDQNTGKNIFCFGVNYQPNIMLNSSTVNMGDSDQRTFTVIIDLTYQIQFPLFIFIDKVEKSLEGIVINFTKFGREPIIDYSTLYLRTTPIDYYLRRTHLFFENDYEIYFDDNNVYIKIKYDPEDLKLIYDYFYRFVDKFGKPYEIPKKDIIFDNTENSITIKLIKNKWETDFRPILNTPLVFQILSEKLTKPTCMLNG